MKLRIALLSALFLPVAGTATATPTSGEAPDSGDATLVAAWNLEPVSARDGYGLRTEAPTQTAVYLPWPCFPFPIPFPNPWPGPIRQCLPGPIY